MYICTLRTWDLRTTMPACALAQHSALQALLLTHLVELRDASHQESKVLKTCLEVARYTLVDGTQ